MIKQIIRHQKIIHDSVIYICRVTCSLKLHFLLCFILLCKVDQSSKEARTVVVTDIPKGESESSLFIHFQKKKNAGGEVEKVRLSRTGETAWVVFEKHEGKLTINVFFSFFITVKI